MDTCQAELQKVCEAFSFHLQCTRISFSLAQVLVVFCFCFLNTCQCDSLKMMLLFKCVGFFYSLVRPSIFQFFLPNFTFFTYESYTSILSPFLLPFVFLLDWNSFDIYEQNLGPFKSYFKSLSSLCKKIY